MRDKTLKFEKYLFYFVIIDILFSPYMFFLATSYSQFFVLVWLFVKDKKEFIIKEYRFYYWILGFILIGCFISLFTIPHDVDYYFIDNIKRGLNLWMGISYYFFFYYIFKYTNIELRKWLIAIVVYITLWGILYYINMNSFFVLKKIFSPYDATLSIKDIIFFRFNFIWTDPNNVGYALVGIVSFLILDKKISSVFLTGIILMLLFCLLLIMSGGSILIFCIIIPITFLFRIAKINSLFNLICLIIFLLFSIYLIFEYSHIILNSDVGRISLERLELKVETEDSRKNIYMNLLASKNIMLYLFTGEGSNIFVGDRAYSPHNGHLMLIYGFGLICYFMYIYVVFRKNKTVSWMNYLPIIPFLFGFTVNIGIGELKFAAILYMIVAFIRIRCGQISCLFSVNKR
jgi:hypothetical protein